MTSNKLSDPYAHTPPLPLPIENLGKEVPLNRSQEEKQDTYPSSSSGNNLKAFSSHSPRALKDYLCSPNQGEVSSVDLHTPPTDSQRDKLGSGDVREARHKRSIDTQLNPPREYHKPKTSHRSQFTIPERKPGLKLLENWHSESNYPCNKDYAEHSDSTFKPRVLAKQIDPEIPLSLHNWHSEINFLEPLALEADIRQEYAVHATYKKDHHDASVKKINDKRQATAEQEAIKMLDWNTPMEFHDVPRHVQQAIYDDKVEVSALTRKIAIRDGHVEGMIAGEFTFHPDTSHLPLTEDQTAVLREAESFQGLFSLEEVNEDEYDILQKTSKKVKPPNKSSTSKSSKYDLWLKEQSSNSCPASKWLDDEVAFSKKKACNKAFSKQVKHYFPTFNSPYLKELPKAVDTNKLEWETEYFPYILPKTDNDAERHNMYETPVKVDVPKWFPTFTSYGVVPINRRNSIEKQYKEFLTHIWRLENQMRSKKSNKKWDKKWHEPSSRWSEPFQKEQFCHKYHKGQEWVTFEKAAPRDLVEQDVVSGEFSFDDVFDMDGSDNNKAIGTKKPEVCLKEIETAVKKAIAKVGI
ncbi:uncharacterized protein FFUJ_04713 [Fusarium fujikuroi IMI 58289]|uniref:Uncharacterized protein n=1 Tax=Gibberella fujikuroi (strain CBS 195.34 / IMI 58289 / NRRL A-6831) TaxID=1279085 RepID=S0DU79_GIBF5|nr:uncharacterized protein FFUJ_04713 [Fusarium fujikuroi IMI 58289]CCT64103.1 uncharacterized protein FFUJ_04713 [Fusarium fujikuroi IMI 58289]SCN99882.1 uncharacterized protein FFM5_07302 [Fusarium fujikuroi]